MKYDARFGGTYDMVTPYAGVWIEIDIFLTQVDIQKVTPYAGVWIEILLNRLRRLWILSLPTRECGLK